MKKPDVFVSMYGRPCSIYGEFFYRFVRAVHVHLSLLGGGSWGALGGLGGQGAWGASGGPSGSLGPSGDLWVAWAVAAGHTASRALGAMPALSHICINIGSTLRNPMGNKTPTNTSATQGVTPRHLAQPGQAEDRRKHVWTLWGPFVYSGWLGPA